MPHLKLISITDRSVSIKSRLPSAMRTFRTYSLKDIFIFALKNLEK